MSKKLFGLQCKSSLLIVLVLLQTYKHDYCGCNHVYTGLFKKIAFWLRFYATYHRFIQYLDNYRLFVDTCV